MSDNTALFVCQEKKAETTDKTVTKPLGLLTRDATQRNEINDVKPIYSQ
jgi:hypothetical protein